MHIHVEDEYNLQDDISSQLGTFPTKNQWDELLYDANGNQKLSDSEREEMISKMVVP